MAEDAKAGLLMPDLMLKLPLYSCVVREHIWLRKFTVSKPYLRRAIEDPRLFRDFSVLKTIRTDESTSTMKDHIMGQMKQKTEESEDRQLKLYDDFQWSTVPGYYWPIHSGDYSPLSPDGEFLERHGKLGLDFWQWHRDSSPLGYVPPLCTCKRTEDCVKHLRRLSKSTKLELEHRVCENDLCRGLLYVPYSLLEIPLNRAISNGSEFALKVRVPDCTDVYCGNMKHTIILCTLSEKHEQECLEAIELTDVTMPLVYDVCSDDFVPYFKPYNETDRESPLMTVEPIDSDISEPEENYGLGQLFAIRKLGANLLIEKYDAASKTTSPIDDPLIETWEKMSNVSLPGDAGSNHPQQASPGRCPSPRANTPGNLNDFKDVKADGEDASVLMTQLRSQEYKIYELIESFSSDRRPLYLSLRTGTAHSCGGGHSRRNPKDLKDLPTRRTVRINRETMESVHLLNELSKI